MASPGLTGVSRDYATPWTRWTRDSAGCPGRLPAAGYCPRLPVLGQAAGHAPGGGGRHGQGRDDHYRLQRAERAGARVRLRGEGGLAGLERVADVGFQAAVAAGRRVDVPLLAGEVVRVRVRVALGVDRVPARGGGHGCPDGRAGLPVAPR